MKRIFVYESLSGGAPADDTPDTAELLEAGVAMRDAIVRDLLRLPGIGVTCAASARAAAPSGAPPATPAPGEPPEAFVRRLARRHDLAWVVAPETDGLLARLHEAVGEARWIGCSGSAIRVASSKRATTAALAGRGIATPLAFAAGHRGRWVVKPDDGAGTLDTRVHERHEAAEADLRQREAGRRSATLEPFIEGEPLSISMLAGSGRARAIAFNRQHLRLDAAGRLHDLGVQSHAIDPLADPRAPRLHGAAFAVAQALPGLCGFVGIDLVWHAERGPVVVEVNPRVTCAYVGLSDKLRRNLAADVLRLHAAPGSLGDAAAA